MKVVVFYCIHEARRTFHKLKSPLKAHNTSRRHQQVSCSIQEPSQSSGPKIKHVLLLVSRPLSLSLLPYSAFRLFLFISSNHLHVLFCSFLRSCCVDSNFMIVLSSFLTYVDSFFLLCLLLPQVRSSVSFLFLRTLVPVTLPS